MPVAFDIGKIPGGYRSLEGAVHCAEGLLLGGGQGIPFGIHCHYKLLQGYLHHITISVGAVCKVRLLFAGLAV